MKTSPSYTLLIRVIRESSVQNCIEWTLAHRSGIQNDPFFILGINALIEKSLNTDNKKSYYKLYNIVRKASIKTPPVNGSRWVKVTLSKQSSLSKIQEVLSKVISSWFRQEISLENKTNKYMLSFSSQEIIVAKYLSKGLSQTHTGIILGLSVKTIHSHKRSLMYKLGCGNNREFQYWLLNGFINIFIS